MERRFRDGVVDRVVDGRQVLGLVLCVVWVASGSEMSVHEISWPDNEDLVFLKSSAKTAIRLQACSIL